MAFKRKYAVYGKLIKETEYNKDIKKELNKYYKSCDTETLSNKT